MIEFIINVILIPFGIGMLIGSAIALFSWRRRR